MPPPHALPPSPVIAATERHETHPQRHIDAPQRNHTRGSPDNACDWRCRRAVAGKRQRPALADARRAHARQGRDRRQLGRLGSVRGAQNLRHGDDRRSAVRETGGHVRSRGALSRRRIPQGDPDDEPPFTRGERRSGLGCGFTAVPAVPGSIASLPAPPDPRFQPDRSPVVVELFRSGRGMPASTSWHAVRDVAGRGEIRCHSQIALSSSVSKTLGRVRQHVRVSYSVENPGRPPYSARRERRGRDVPVQFWPGGWLGAAGAGWLGI